MRRSAPFVPVLGLALALGISGCGGAASNSGSGGTTSESGSATSDAQASSSESALTSDQSSTASASSAANEATQTDESETWIGPSDADAKSRPALFPKLDDKSALENAYTFTVNGTPYKLGSKMSALLDNGWSEEPPEGWTHSVHHAPSEPIDSMTYADVELFSNSSCIGVLVVNATDEALDWRECVLGGFDIEVSNNDALPSFETSAGISLDSSVEDVLDAYGSPQNSSTMGTIDGGTCLSTLSYSATLQAQEDAGEFTIKATAVNTLRNGHDSLDFSFDADGKISRIYTYYTI